MERMNRDSAQVIVLTGFLVAIAILGVSSVLNGLIYSEQLASRGSGADETTLRMLSESTQTAVREAAAGNGTTPSKAEDHYDAYISDYHDALQPVLSETSRLLYVDPASADTETVWAFGQMEHDDLLNYTDDDTWVMAESVNIDDWEDIYRMRINMSTDSSEWTGDFTLNASTSGSYASRFKAEFNHSDQELKVREGSSETFDLGSPSDGNITKNGDYVTLHLGKILRNLSFVDDPSNTEIDALRVENGAEGNATYDFRFYDGITTAEIKGPCSDAPCRGADAGRYVVGIVHEVEGQNYSYDDALLSYNGNISMVTATEDIPYQQAQNLQGAAFYEVQIASTNSPITEGDTLEVTVEVTNTGTKDGDQTITLEIGGTQEDTWSAQVVAGASKTETLHWPTDTDEAGIYTAEVSSEDDYDSQDVTVEDSGGGGGGGGPPGGPGPPA